MKKLVIVAAMVAVIFASMASFKTTKASADNSAPVSSAVTVISVSSSTGFNIPSPSINANVEYATFPAGFAPYYCIAGFEPNGTLYINNGASTVTLRYNTARGGWDQFIVDGVVIAIDPDRTQKLAAGNCFIKP